MTDVASQGQAVARQQNRWLEGFVIALASAAILVTLGWGAFTALSAPSTVAPSKTTTQIVQDRGLLEQRAGERGGAVAQPVQLPKLHPYVSLRPSVGTSERGMELPNGTFWTPPVSETRRGMELPNGTFWTPPVSVHERGHSRGRD
jgi:hypothetical protein